jgi:hypothetical protein
VADVELVGPPLDLLAVRLALEHRAQQQLADPQAEREDADDAGAVALEPVDGHRRQRSGRQLPRQHGDEHGPEERRQRAAAQQHRVRGDHREVEHVGAQEHDEHGDREGAVRQQRRVVDALEDQAAHQREERVRREDAEHLRPAGAPADDVHGRAGQPHRGRRRGAEQRHGEHEPHERAGDAEALGLERQEIAADDEHREQPDELVRLPLLGRRRQRRQPDAGGEQRRLHRRDGPGGHRPHAREVERPRGRPLATQGRLAARGAHQRQRPRDDHHPQCDR